jgi:hypothetical protein
MKMEFIFKTEDPDEARRLLDAIKPVEAAAAPQPNPTSAPVAPTEPAAPAPDAPTTPSEDEDFTAPPKPAQPALKFAADPHVTDQELMDACGEKSEALQKAGRKKAEAMAAIKAVIGKYVGEGASPSTMGQSSRNTFLRELGELA